MRQPPILEKESFIPARVQPGYISQQRLTFCVALHAEYNAKAERRAAVNSLLLHTYFVCGHRSTALCAPPGAHSPASPLWWIFERNYRVRDNNTWRKSVSFADLDLWTRAEIKPPRVGSFLCVESSIVENFNFVNFHCRRQFLWGLNLRRCCLSKQDGYLTPKPMRANFSKGNWSY